MLFRCRYVDNGTMLIIDFLLLLAGFLCFLGVAFKVSVNKFELLGLGLALWILVPLIAAGQRLF